MNGIILFEAAVRSTKGNGSLPASFFDANIEHCDAFEVPYPLVEAILHAEDADLVCEDAIGDLLRAGLVSLQPSTVEAIVKEVKQGLSAFATRKEDIYSMASDVDFSSVLKDLNVLRAELLHFNGVSSPEDRVLLAEATDFIDDSEESDLEYDPATGEYLPDFDPSEY